MTVFVTIEAFQGIVGGVTVFLTPESAKQAEDRWLEKNGVKDKICREAKAKNGTEFLVMESELKP